ncbi:uncharacterized protein PAC_14279 [Phialocephala subalpina]|uniref:DUF1254 domain-containing protein n=1 Tax=Phialocephala subalpina TaxID=576137 RepID=A0A1L7XH75_9HELO|nr:uncharacterized protein PAC_14279 [Phialocephala subalpina]
MSNFCEATPPVVTLFFCDNMSVLNATYGLPPLSYAKLAAQFVNVNITNTFVHETQLSTPASTTVVLPNTDTLYSAAVYDLSQNDVRITVPNIESESFGNNDATPGSVHNNTGGTYLLSYISNPAWGFHPYASESGSPSPYKGLVNPPTIDGTILSRTFVKNNASDLTYVRSITNATSLKVVPRTRHHANGANCTNSMSTTILTNSTMFVNTTIITNNTVLTNNTLIMNTTNCTNTLLPPSLTKGNLTPYTTGNETALTTLELLANFFNANPPFDISAANVEHVLGNISVAGVYARSYR